MDQNFGDLKFNQSHQSQGKNPDTGDVVLGQKIVICAVLMNFLAIGAMFAVAGSGVSEELGGMLILGSWGVRLLALILGIFGLLKIGSGLRWSGFSKILLVIGLFVPMLNVILLLLVNGQATAYLKAAGYKVGLAGAYKPK